MRRAGPPDEPPEAAAIGLAHAAATAAATSSASESTSARKSAPISRLANWSAARDRLRCAPPTAPGGDRLRAQFRIELQRDPGHAQRGRARLGLQRAVVARGRRLLWQIGRGRPLGVLHDLGRLQPYAVHVHGLAQQLQRQWAFATRRP